MTIGNAGRDLLVHLALLVPLEFVMKSPRIAGKVSQQGKQRGVAVAMGVLLTVSAIKIGWEIAHKEASYYDLIDVSPTAPSAELKKGYKRASLRVHPDKLHAAAAAAGEAEEEGNDEAFLALKAAYDVLSDAYQRDVYNKFGPAGLDAKDDTSTLLAGLGFFYVVWLTLAYLLTRRKAVGRAQTWSFSGLMALGIFEYQACILNFDFLEELLPNLVMFEKIELLHRIYPVFLLGARMVAWLMYEDVDAYSFVMLQHLHWKTDRLRDRLVALGGGQAYAPGTVPYASPQQWSTFAQKTLLEAQRRGMATGGTLPPAESASVGGAAAGAPASSIAEVTPAPPSLGGPPAPGSKPAAAKGGGRNLGGLVWFFGVYFFFQWLIGRGS